MTELIIRPDWLTTDLWPWEVRTLPTPTGRIAYTDTGSGPTLLLVHSGTWSFIWRDLIRRLEPHFRVIAFDPPAMGLSDTGEGAGIEPTAHAIDALVTALDLREITLALHDLGGPAGLDAASRWPDRVAGLVAVNCFGWRPDAAAFRTMLHIVGNPVFREIDAATDLLPALSSTRFGVGRHFSKADRTAFRRGFGPRGRRSFHHNMASAIDHDFAAVDAGRDAIANTPILTVFGEKNDPLGFQPRWKAVGDDVEQVVIPGGLHFPMCDDPATVATAIVDWHGRKFPDAA